MIRFLSRAFAFSALAGCLLTAPGCIFGTSPDKVNVELRKQKQALEEQVAGLQQRVSADEQIIQSLRSSIPTQPTLPPGRLARLFTTHSLKLGRLTGGADLDPQKPGDDGLKVYVAPVDEEGTPIKAAGSFVVEAFDLAAPQSPSVGRWEFDLGKTRKMWSSFFTDYNYVLACPWQSQKPVHPELTLKITFTDELTGLHFTDQRRVTIALPPASPTTLPTTAPATRP